MESRYTQRRIAAGDDPFSSPFCRDIGDLKFQPIAATRPGAIPHEHCLVELDILMMRPGYPGGLIGAADIDNRLKTLFDALQVPDANQATKLTNPSSTDPIFCLLDDDRMISRVNVRTQQYWEVDETSREVALVIEATMYCNTVV